MRLFVTFVVVIQLRFVAETKTFQAFNAQLLNSPRPLAVLEHRSISLLSVTF